MSNYKYQFIVDVNNPSVMTYVKAIIKMSSSQVSFYEFLKRTAIIRIDNKNVANEFLQAMDPYIIFIFYHPTERI